MNRTAFLFRQILSGVHTCTPIDEHTQYDLECSQSVHTNVKKITSYRDTNFYYQLVVNNWSHKTTYGSDMYLYEKLLDITWNVQHCTTLSQRARTLKCYATSSCIRRSVEQDSQSHRYFRRKSIRKHDRQWWICEWTCSWRMKLMNL